LLVGEKRMANEIKISTTINVETADGGKITKSSSFTDDMTGNSFVSAVQVVGASSEQIVTHGDITTYGWIYLKNLGTNDSNYVDFGHNTAALNGDDNICRLYGGESCVLKCSAGDGSATTVTALHAISSSGDQLVEYLIVEL
jgi:hypothetical protein